MRLLRTKRARSVAAVATAVLAVNSTFVAPAVAQRWDAYQLTTQSYKAKYGHWDEITLPAGMRFSAVHAALLNTGKILITAGSANNAQNFDAGQFLTVVYDPQTRTSRTVPTPTDMFCGGQAFLPDGRLLIAGGTQNYEVIGNAVTKAGGVVTITSTDTSGTGRIIADHTVLTGTNGHQYLTDVTTSIPPATWAPVGKHGRRLVPARATVWAWAKDAGKASEWAANDRLSLSINGLDPTTARTLQLTSARMRVNRHDFEGSAYSYIFDPATETYSRVADLTVKRWYPTLAPLADGNVLAVSGLNGVGQLEDAAHSSELFDVRTQTWRARPDLTQQFGTYPALFQTSSPDQLFYTGSNTGYGTDALNHRSSGLWNLRTNQFTAVPGIRDPELTDSSGSAWLGPVQDQRLALVGGGKSGETTISTDRIDLVDLMTADPHWTAGPSLPHAARYPLLVNLPDDTLFITGGSSAYRGEFDSSNHDARVLHPDGTLTRAASPQVARSYHSEAMLLPDGRVLTMGSNPLWADAADTQRATFEQRLELYTPAYLYHGTRPIITAAPASARIGATISVGTASPATISRVRLIHPSAVTHSLNLTQRAVDVPITSRTATGLNLTLPISPGILPAGWYMLFLLDSAGVPSVAKWVQIT